MVRSSSCHLLLYFCYFAFPGQSRNLRHRAINTSAPIVVPASQNFEGNDGPWSTFTLQVGTPAQDVRVMVSTQHWQTLVINPLGCGGGEPQNCADLRGGLFNQNDSTTWLQNDVSPNGTFEIGVEQNLGYTGNGLYGADTVALGWQGSNGPSLDQQVVGSIATPDFYMGVFGLDPRPTNFSTFTNPVPSYMQNLKSQNLIPSLSWAYTAGNQYRLDKVLGSLTLGGYDSSRFVPNNLSFPFGPQDIRRLSVGISSITYDDRSKQRTLLTDDIIALVDSTIPWLYLPLEVCKSFEAAFGLQYDDNSAVYLVNDTLHSRLQDENATVTFTLSSPRQSGSVDIALPYAAFDLIAEYPLAENQTRYFPLARATNASQFTLGRTFFQEAYVIVDYERQNFSVSECNWDPNAQQHILPIKTLAAEDQKGSTSHKLSAGTIAGIVIGVIAGLALLGVLGFFGYKRFFQKSAGTEEEGKAEPESNSSLVHELKGDQQIKQELDAKQGLEFGHDGKPFLSYGSPGFKATNELDGGAKAGHELDSGQVGAREMPAREPPAAELP